MKKVFLILLICSISQAQWFNVQDLYVEGQQFSDHSVDYFTRTLNRKLNKGLNLGMNIDFLSIFYFDNLVISRTSCLSSGVGCQFGSIAYDFKVGARITSYLDIEYRHKSSHALDNNFNMLCEDSIGFRFHFINSTNRDSLLP